MGTKKICHTSGRNQLYIFTKRAIKVTAVITEAYPAANFI
jgi:hypothetical protein